MVKHLLNESLWPPRKVLRQMLQQLVDNDIEISCFHNEKTGVEVSVRKTLNTVVMCSFEIP